MKNYFEIKLLYKESDYREEIGCHGSKNRINILIIIRQVSYMAVQKISQSSLVECRDRESQEFSLWIIHKLLAETEEENLYICDGKMMNYND